MKKIIVDKADGIAEIIDHIFDESDEEITLVVPRGSLLVRTMSNFRLLKREADAAGKGVAVESVDETVLAFAKECGIQAFHPLWRGTRDAEGGGMSDIVPKSRRTTPSSGRRAAGGAGMSILGSKKRRVAAHQNPDPEPELEEEDVDMAEYEEEEAPARAPQPFRVRAHGKNLRYQEEDKNEEDEDEEEEVSNDEAEGIAEGDFEDESGGDGYDGHNNEEDAEEYSDDDDAREMIEEEDEEEEERASSSARRFFSKRPVISASPRGYGGGRGRGRAVAHDDDDDDEYEDDDEYRPRRRRLGARGWTVIVVIILVAAGAAYIASAYFNHANVAITFKKTPWSWQGNLTVDTSVATDNLGGGVLAGQIFTANKDITKTFKASSMQNVSLYAHGTITIYNDYSTRHQELVVRTRFLTPDGKIFRITHNVIVPGATKNANGTLTPSSITAPIVANQPGPTYNIGPVAKLSIPGFKGYPQYGHFWGTINASTTGGFVGQKAVPTAADITAAKASTTAALQASLRGGFSGSYPNNFKILSSATNIQTGTLVVNTTTNSQGDFTVFATATLQAIGFDETALKTALLAEAQSTEASSSFADITLNYQNVTPDLAHGKVSFSLSAKGDLEPAFSPVDFEQKILGKSVAQARTTISSLPQLSSAEISIWPSWLSTVPSTASKVHISVH